MKKLLITAVMGSVFLASGCATQTGLIQPTQKITPEYTKSQTFFIGGIGQEHTLNAAEVCGGAQNVAKVQTVQEAKDIALGLVTLGIYTPRTAKVFCR